MKGISKITATLLLTFAVLILVLHASEITHAAETNVTVDVNITALSEITISPASINWTLVTPGQAGGLRYLDIQNTGSVNVTNIYAFVTTLQNETVRPYGSSDAKNYSAGGVLVFRNSTSTQMFWAGRIEWNWTGPINNIDLSAIDANSRAAYGFFRNASDSYVWAVGNGTNGYCNSSNTVFALESDVDDGTQATRTPTTNAITLNYNDTQFSYFSVDRSVLNGMCVAVSADCQKIFVYKYDKRANFTQCANSRYIRDNNLVPWEIEQITADVWMPKGIPMGNMTQTIWTFIAS